MKKIEMNWLQAEIYNAIKDKCTNPDNDYIANYKPVEFIEMKESDRGTVRCCGGEVLTHYEVRTRHKAAKYDDNIAIWDICVYSNGDCGIYFDGAEYRA